MIFAALEAMEGHLHSDVGLVLWPGVPQLPPAPVLCPEEHFEEVCGGQRANPLGLEVSPPFLPAFLSSSPDKPWGTWKVQGAFTPLLLLFLSSSRALAGQALTLKGQERKGRGFRCPTPFSECQNPPWEAQ